MKKIRRLLVMRGKIRARRLYNDLGGAGLNPWLDKEKLLPGHN
jgi:hypothetical protein